MTAPTHKPLDLLKNYLQDKHITDSEVSNLTTAIRSASNQEKQAIRQYLSNQKDCFLPPADRQKLFNMLQSQRIPIRRDFCQSSQAALNPTAAAQPPGLESLLFRFFSGRVNASLQHHYEMARSNSDFGGRVEIQLHLLPGGTIERVEAKSNNIKGPDGEAFLRKVEETIQRQRSIGSAPFILQPQVEQYTLMFARP